MTQHSALSTQHFVLVRVLIVLLLALAFVGCGLRRTPNLERIFSAARARQGKRPVIIIPGILGSQLVNAKTREVVWPSVFRSSDDDLDLPISADLASNRDDLVASRILDVAKFARYLELHAAGDPAFDPILARAP